MGGGGGGGGGEILQGTTLAVAKKHQSLVTPAAATPHTGMDDIQDNVSIKQKRVSGGPVPGADQGASSGWRGGPCISRRRKF